MFRKILKVISFRKVGEISVQQSFPVYGLDPETYRVTFFENLFIRKIQVTGSEILEENRLWMGTEFYAMTITPWLNNLMTNSDLRQHLQLVWERCENPKKTVIKNRSNNVVQFRIRNESINLVE